MSVARARRSGTNRGRSSPNGSSEQSEAPATTRGGQSSSATTRGRQPRNASTRGRAGSSGSRQTAASSRSRTEARASSRARATSKRVGTSASDASHHSSRETITNVGIPVATAALGVAGGVLLGRTTLRRNRTLWGIPVPNKLTVNGISGMAQRIGEVGRQLGKLASEVHAVREKAEQIGRVIA
jgi:hypothetical protein